MVRLALCLLLAASPGSVSQEWERIKADGSLLWGEGWGTSVEEADRSALAALASRISVAVVSDFRQVEEQVRSSKGDEHYVMQSNRTATTSCLTLSNTHRLVLREGRRAHVGRWIRRDELDGLFSAREARVLEYEDSALRAEASGRVGDALRYHWWAYALLRSLPRPADLRDEYGRMLLNTIPESIGAIFDDLKVSCVSRSGGTITLAFAFRGWTVSGIDYTYFDGTRWLPGQAVRAGRASLEMAPGALAETIQLRIEYAYAGEAMVDDELATAMVAMDTRPLKKSFIIFRARL
jgi:hypothetical protein